MFHFRALSMIRGSKVTSASKFHWTNASHGSKQHLENLINHQTECKIACESSGVSYVAYKSVLNAQYHVTATLHIFSPSLLRISLAVTAFLHSPSRHTLPFPVAPITWLPQPPASYPPQPNQDSFIPACFHLLLPTWALYPYALEPIHFILHQTWAK